MPKIWLLGALLVGLACSGGGALAGEGAIAITTDPAEAEVYVDGALKATSTPLVLRVPEGRRRIEVRKQGFRTTTLDVFIADGAVISRQVELVRAGPTVGSVFRDCSDCPEMVVLPRGRFMMGSPETEPGRDRDEGPRHRVTIDYDLAVGRYEVTFADWDACVSDGGCGGYRPNDRGWGRGRRPVINVSWDDIRGYLDWLSRKTGQRYRLLSEGEWEYAARGGSTTPFWWGSTITTDQANYDGNYVYNNGRKGVYRQKTVEVGSFAANLLGICSSPTPAFRPTHRG